MSDTDSDLMASLGALFTEAQAKLTRAAVNLAGGDHDLAAAIMRAALTDMEAIQRADFINAVYTARKDRAAKQEGASNE